MYICIRVVNNKLVIMDYKEMCLSRVIDEIDKIIDSIDLDLIKRDKCMITFCDLSLLFFIFRKNVG